MTLAQTTETAPLADEDRRRRRIRRWVGAAIVLLLMFTGVRIGQVDARAEILLSAWGGAWMAAAVWLLTDLRRWIWKILFGLCIASSIGAAAQGVGYWHTECVEKDTGGASHFSYCIPRLGPSPDFR
jgi:hypothetical protein